MQQGILKLFFFFCCLSACKGNNGSYNIESETDKKLQQLIQQHQLSGDPSKNRDIPAINSPLAQLGLQLFFTKALGGDVDTACVSCHHPFLGGGDALSLSIGVGAVLPDVLGVERVHASVAPHFDGTPPVPRNAPTTFNIALWDQVIFHDGRIESLQKTPLKHGEETDIRTPDTPFGVADPLAGKYLSTAQARFPVTSAEEMRGFTFAEGETTQQLRHALMQRLTQQQIPNTWLTEFQHAFNSQEDANTLMTYENVAEAISAYERSQVFINTPWKAYIEGDISALSDEAKQGALLFYTPITEGGAECVRCHQGDFFTDEGFHVLAIPQIGRGQRKGEQPNDDLGRFLETQNPDDRYAFRTPSLINVEMTAPYGHDGAYASLEGIIAHHINPEQAIANYDFTLNHLPQVFFSENAEKNTQAALTHLQQLQAKGVQPVIQAINLSEVQQQQLKAFLLSLTDPCIKDLVCLAPWLPDSSQNGVDSLQLNPSSVKASNN